MKDKVFDFSSYLCDLLYKYQIKIYMILGLITIILCLFRSNMYQVTLWFVILIFIKEKFEGVLDSINISKGIGKDFFNIIELFLLILFGWVIIAIFKLMRDSFIEGIPISEIFLHKNKVDLIIQFIIYSGFTPLIVFSYKKFTRKTIKVTFVGLIISIVFYSLILRNISGYPIILASDVLSLIILYVKKNKIIRWRQIKSEEYKYRFMLDSQNNVKKIYRYEPNMINSKIRYIKKYNKGKVNEDWISLEKQINKK